MVKDVEGVKKRLKEIDDEEKFCLHFDGKKIEGKKYQVVCLQNSDKTLNFDVLKCKSGSAEDIYSSMKALLDKYDA